jgi:hypothetical protein
MQLKISTCYSPKLGVLSHYMRQVHHVDNIRPLISTIRTVTHSKVTCKSDPDTHQQPYGLLTL